MTGNTYLITGGASLIGSHICDQLLAGGARQVRLLDNYSLGTPDTIAHLENDARVLRITGDILNPQDLAEATQGVEGVFALAGYLTLPMAIDPLKGVSVNAIGMINTLEACRTNKVRRIVFSSSVAAYGAPEVHPVREDSPYHSAGLQPASRLYGATKLLGEALCARYYASDCIEYNSLRFASVYGERQHSRAVNANFVARVCRQVLAGEDPDVEGDGEEVHDYVYVTDVARACVLAMSSESHGNELNICTGVDSSSATVARVALQVAGRDPSAIRFVDDSRNVRSAAGKRLGFSRDAAAKAIGWTPEIDLEQGIRRLMAWQGSKL